MSELEAFGRHVGALRKLEPRIVHVICAKHVKPEKSAVAVLPDEYVALCCFGASVDVPYKFRMYMKPGRVFGVALGAELL